MLFNSTATLVRTEHGAGAWSTDAMAATGHKLASLCAVRSAKQGLRPRHHLLVGNRSPRIHIGKSSQCTLMLLFIRWHRQACQQVDIGEFHIKAPLKLTGHYSAQKKIEAAT